MVMVEQESLMARPLRYEEAGAVAVLQLALQLAPAGFPELTAVAGLAGRG
jgi:hypothetical protein